MRRAFLMAIAAWSAKVWTSDVLAGERLRVAPHDYDDDPDQIVVDHDRHPEHRSIEARGRDTCTPGRPGRPRLEGRR
jgi:hypothetical protein